MLKLKYVKLSRVRTCSEVFQHSLRENRLIGIEHGWENCENAHGRIHTWYLFFTDLMTYSLTSFFAFFSSFHTWMSQEASKWLVNGV